MKIVEEESADVRRRRSPLFQQLHWFIRLRWLAGFAVIVGGIIDWQYTSWYDHGPSMVVVGLCILAYNVGLWKLVEVPKTSGHDWRRSRRWLVGVASLQIFLDLACLTLLTMWTGGNESPLRGFYVLHMVFASLLLPRIMAYGGAALAVAMMEVALWFAGQWIRSRQDTIQAIAWVIMLLATVHLTNHIMRNLRAQRVRLIHQNRHIRAISERLQKQQDLMLQQEKMVAMGRMAAGVAHEIANPLASMDGLLQLMERKPEKERVGAVGTLREQVARINQIVRRMTAFAHPGDGQWEVTDLNEVVRKALGVMSFDPRMKKVQLVEEFGPGIPPVRMLTADMQQVIVNLVINALDAMEGVAKGVLRVRTSLVGGDVCRLTVEDNGHGIEAENVSRLFEPFFTTKPVGKGTGLGLSISYSLVRKHGGEISLQSEVGKGTIFQINLPIGGGKPEVGEAPLRAVARDDRNTAV